MIYFHKLEQMKGYNYDSIINYLNYRKIKFKLDYDGKVILDDFLINQLNDKDLVKNFVVLEDNDGFICKKYNSEIVEEVKTGIIDNFENELILKINDYKIPFYFILSSSS